MGDSYKIVDPEIIIVNLTTGKIDYKVHHNRGNYSYILIIKSNDTILYYSPTNYINVGCNVPIVRNITSLVIEFEENKNITKVINNNYFTNPSISNGCNKITYKL